MSLDKKQLRLIHSWLERAALSPSDEYGSFMAAWIAFNAFCYALFAAEANGPRADLAKNAQFPQAGDAPVGVSGSFRATPNGGKQIRLDEPCKVRIDIKERYTEDLIFRAFGAHYQQDFIMWRQDPQFLDTCEQFLAGITKPNGRLVVNMLRARDYSPDTPLKDLRAGAIVKAICNPSRLGEYVDVLYQVRCNVFHGEKVPGDWNDDRVVKVARPLVVAILTRALAAKPSVGPGSTSGPPLA